ncbi:MAG TPA: hemerythrin domain-containing protein [Acidimicrobiales bacterium]|nr:hemerythrin domain-containing protein [Acidimicrobiales bacterium]
MTTRAQVLQLIEQGASYPEAGTRLGIPPGQAYLVATGIPADGGDSVAPEEGARRGVLAGSTQGLSNPPHENPTRKPEVLAWARRLAGSDPQMRATADGHEVAPAPIRGEGPAPDALDVLGRRHNQVATLLKRLSQTRGVTEGGGKADQAARESIVDMVTVRLAAHEAAEEGYFWPLVRDRVPGGGGLAHEAIGQEQQGADVMQRLSNVPASEPEFDQLAHRLSTLAQIHVAFEDRVFLAVRAAVGRDELTRLGGRLVEAHELGPTRPHPRAPRRSGAAAKIAGVMVGAVDDARDRRARAGDGAESSDGTRRSPK